MIILPKIKTHYRVLMIYKIVKNNEIKYVSVKHSSYHDLNNLVDINDIVPESIKVDQR